MVNLNLHCLPGSASETEAIKVSFALICGFIIKQFTSYSVWSSSRQIISFRMCRQDMEKVAVEEYKRYKGHSQVRR